MPPPMGHPRYVYEGIQDLRMHSFNGCYALDGCQPFASIRAVSPRNGASTGPWCLAECGAQKWVKKCPVLGEMVSP